MDDDITYREKVRNTVRGENDSSLAYLLRTTVAGTVAREEVELEIERRESKPVPRFITVYEYPGVSGDEHEPSPPNQG